ncbi:hypothetical protein [Halovivax gelatinilyticus]|uniref:hypothetical protein n=1 Tax=Halovivax gelatinilyticus TaxID=2961597 RepID=UPI0020CA4273|nr:hypothetical protein [Halovivax gelatinilyticus]
MDELPSSPESFDDPRVSGPFYRHCSGDHDVLVLGVVHDHPASVGRVETVLESVEPDHLALELPSAAIPLYKAYASRATGENRPPVGGEMSAAIAAASAPVTGIDAPSWSFFRRLVTRLVTDRVRPSTARRVLASFGGATRTALTCRLAATMTNVTTFSVTRDDAIEYECSHDDSPARQAEHERNHVAGVRALLQSTAGESKRYRDETREACMIDRLRSLREEGSVVAVVGVDHLEPIAAALTEP